MSVRIQYNARTKRHISSPIHLFQSVFDIYNAVLLNPEFKIAGFPMKTLHNMDLPGLCYNEKLNEVQGRLANHLITQFYALIKHLTSCSGVGIFF